MKNLLRFILWIIAIGICFAWLTVIGPDVRFTLLPSDGEYPHITIDSGGKLYQEENVWVYAYLMNTPTTTTSDEARYPMSGAFINEVSQWFIGSGQSIVYQWNQKLLRYVITWYGTTDTTATHMDIWVKHNGNFLTGSLGWLRLANASDYGSTISISQATMTSWDTIQIVIRSNKNAELTPEMVTAYASPLY